MPFIGVIAFQLLSLYPWDHQEVVTEKRMYPEHVDVLPTELLDELKWIPLIAFGVSMLNTVQGSVGRCHFGLLEFLPSSNGRACMLYRGLNCLNDKHDKSILIIFFH